MVRAGASTRTKVPAAAEAAALQNVSGNVKNTTTTTIKKVGAKVGKTNAKKNFSSVSAKAAAYDDLTAKTRRSGTRLQKGKRTLTPGARAKQAGTARQGEKAARARAMKTGKPEDVAALL